LDHITGLPSGVGSVLRCPCNVNQPSVLGLYASTSLQKPLANAQTEKRTSSNKTLRQTLKHRSKDVPGQMRGSKKKKKIIQTNEKKKTRKTKKKKTKKI